MSGVAVRTVQRWSPWPGRNTGRWPANALRRTAVRAVVARGGGSRGRCRLYRVLLIVRMGRRGRLYLFPGGQLRTRARGAERKTEPVQGVRRWWARSVETLEPLSACCSTTRARSPYRLRSLASPRRQVPCPALEAPARTGLARGSSRRRPGRLRSNHAHCTGWEWYPTLANLRGSDRGDGNSASTHRGGRGRDRKSVV